MTARRFCPPPFATAVETAIAAVLFPLCLSAAAAAEPADAPVSLNSAFAIARELRAEMRVSAARVDAARQRPAIVSALDDPVLSPSIDHKPVDAMMKTDRSITYEQSFPLSRIRTHRRSAAEADIGKYEGEAAKAVLRIQAEVAQAFFMLGERRAMGELLARQTALSAQLVQLAAKRHALGVAGQADVLRAEMEQARLRGRLAASAAEVRSAEAMFNTALGRGIAASVPPVLAQDVLARIARAPDLPASLARARERRPELRISQAEGRRARAEIDVMKAMYAPMLMVRLGMADTMTAGRGYMLMVGISLPIWRTKLDAGVREAHAMAAMAEADREAMLRMIDGEVAATLEALRGASLYYQAFETDLIPRAERAMAPALNAYASGTLPLTGVLETSRALWSVQEEAVMAQTALAMAWIRHCGAMGDFGAFQ